MSAVQSTPSYPWEQLPRDQVRATVGQMVPDLVEEIVRVIPERISEYARPLDGEFGVTIRRGVSTAMNRLFLELPGSREPAFVPDTRNIYRSLGTGEARSGRSLEALLGAYRLGAQITFRTVARGALEAGLSQEDALSLGESIFVYFDEISGASIEGFAEEQSRQVGARDRARQALLNLLVGPRVDEAEARRTAAHAGWRIPSSVVVIVLPLENAEGLRLQLGDRALVSARAGQAVALAPAPRTQAARESLERTLDGRFAWIGPARPWDRAAESSRLATLALAMPGAPEPRWVRDHLVDVMLAGQKDLVDDLTRVRLAPVEGLTDGQRERMLETLLAWLRRRGERRRIADDLHVHPQTVGYRLGQLRKIFGDDLENPDARFELELVLRAREH